MARNDRLIRALTVAAELAASRFGVPLKTLAERNRWDLRTVYRDVEALQAAGFNIEVEGAKYRLANWPVASELGITAEEMVALFTARQLAAGIKHTSVGRALERMWGKLTIQSKKRSGELLPPGPAPWLLVSGGPGIETRDYRDHVTLLDEAARGRRVVACSYRAADGEETERDLEPNELYWDPRLETLYLIAWCRLRQDVRFFATHRFRRVQLTDETFTPRAAATSRAALRSAFRVWRSQHVVRVRLAFSGSAAARVRERRWHGSQRLRELEDGVELTVDVAGLEEIESWILSWGPDVTVLAPASLAARIGARSAAVAARHGILALPRGGGERAAAGPRVGAARRSTKRRR
jgi:proteasome accessory factor B